MKNDVLSHVEDSSYAQLSFCGVMKENTSELMQKLESEMPSLFQEYSDLYTRYLHSVQDIYGACSLVERQYFENLKVDKNILKEFDDYSKSLSRILESYFDLSASLIRSYVQARLSFIDFWDPISHLWINMYAKTIPKFLSSSSNNNRVLN